MKTKEKNMKSTECACGEKMQKDIQGMVKGATKPTDAEHEKKQGEIEDAFNQKK